MLEEDQTLYLLDKDFNKLFLNMLKLLKEAMDKKKKLEQNYVSSNGKYK